MNRFEVFKQKNKHVWDRLYFGNLQNEYAIFTMYGTMHRKNSMVIFYILELKSTPKLLIFCEKKLKVIDRSFHYSDFDRYCD